MRSRGGGRTRLEAFASVSCPVSSLLCSPFESSPRSRSLIQGIFNDMGFYGVLSKMNTEMNTENDTQKIEYETEYES